MTKYKYKKILFNKIQKGLLSFIPACEYSKNPLRTIRYNAHVNDLKEIAIKTSSLPLINTIEGKKNQLGCEC